MSDMAGSVCLRPMSAETWWQAIGQRNAALVQALRTRPLTLAELQEVGAQGYQLLVRFMVPYHASEKQAEFAALLALQQIIQMAAARQKDSADV